LASNNEKERWEMEVRLDDYRRRDTTTHTARPIK